VEQVAEKLSAFVEHFNHREYRKALDPVEDLWLKDRDDFYTGLIRVAVALHQMDTRGLTQSPRYLLETAASLLAPFAPWHRGIDVAALLGLIARCRELVEAQAASGATGPVAPPTHTIAYIPPRPTARAAWLSWYRRLFRGRQRDGRRV
jgi:hypothetical protein